MPDYLEPDVDPVTDPAALPTGGASARFGRRFEVIGFRWLAKE